MATYGSLPGRFPAIVRSYDQARRTCRIEIPGLTDGADVFPEAEIEYAIGDKSAHASYPTEVEILPGDAVWISFIGGDPRYPIITGYRNPQAGNSVDWRRVHHKNIEALADVTIHIQSGDLIKCDSGNSIETTSGKTITVSAGSTITLTGGTSITFKVGGSTLVIGPSNISLTSGQINLNGPISGGGTDGATASFSGEIRSDKDVKAGSISLINHIHQGVHGPTSDPE